MCWFAFMLFHRPMTTQLAAPKIPEGERVDFDVCSFKVVINGTWFYMIAAAKAALNNLELCIHWFLLGHPQETDGERSSGAADSDWCPLWAEEERGRRADRTQRQDCNDVSHAVSPVYLSESEIHWLIRIIVIKKAWLKVQMACFFCYRRAGGQKEPSSSVWGLKKSGTDRHGLRWLLHMFISCMLIICSRSQ